MAMVSNTNFMPRDLTPSTKRLVSGNQLLPSATPVPNRLTLVSEKITVSAPLARARSTSNSSSSARSTTMLPSMRITFRCPVSPARDAAAGAAVAVAAAPLAWADDDSVLPPLLPPLQAESIKLSAAQRTPSGSHGDSDGDSERQRNFMVSPLRTATQQHVARHSGCASHGPRPPSRYANVAAATGGAGCAGLACGWLPP
jgi:hypothetical protein